MNKQSSLLVTMILSVTCVACVTTGIIFNRKNKDLSDTVESSTQEAVTSIEKATTSVSPEFNINFYSAKEVEEVSDEKLSSFLSAELKSIDIIHDLVCVPDYFDIELYSSGTENCEKILYSPLRFDIGRDMKTEISDEEMKFLTEQRNKSIGENDDAEYIFCGENDDYVEYSVRYTDRKSYYDNDTLKEKDIYRTYRVFYPKRTVMLESDNALNAYFVGEPTMDNVQRCLDFEFSISDELVLYREYFETDEDIVCTYYSITQNAMTADSIAGLDEDIALYAQLNKDTIAVDKKSNEIRRKSELVREVKTATLP